MIPICRRMDVLHFVLRTQVKPTGRHQFISHITSLQKLAQSCFGVQIDDSTPKNTDELLHHPLLSHITTHIASNKLVPSSFLKGLLVKSVDSLVKEKNVIAVERHREPDGAVEGKVVICGDTHGQYKDFLQIFRTDVAGSPSLLNKFVFNGDIADRGPQAVEIFTVLLTMKMLSPDAVHILRGNHESLQMTRSFGFKGEVVRKYDDTMYELFLKMFYSLPVSAVIDDSVFVVHGGLGPKTFSMSINELQSFSRFEEDNEHLLELLWSDPRDDLKKPYEFNYNRGGGILFGSSLTSSFLERNQLSLIVRSHEMMTEGFNIMHNQRLMTVFSAPNYCGVWKNKGAVLQLSGQDDKLNAQIIQFNAVDMESKTEKIKRQKGARA